MSEPAVPNDTQDGRADDPVFDRRDWLQITLSCIGDGVITADAEGRVNYLNPVAEELTGWSLDDATGLEVEQVFRIVNETTREPVDQPVRKVIERGLTVGLGNHTILIARDGGERPIDDSAAPIKDDRDRVVGVVLIFRDITDRRRGELLAESARLYAESILKTVREPLIILDARLHVRSANRAFYEAFQVHPPETEGHFIYDLGNGQWDIPGLRTLLEEIVPLNNSFENFAVEHDFEDIGYKAMLLNARRFPPEDKYELILLAIQDVTEKRRAEEQMKSLVEELARADRRKDEFLAMLAHELRGPLSAIGAAVALSERGGLSEEDAAWSREVSGRQVAHLSRLIDDLLDVSRITTGKILLSNEPVEVRTAVERAVAVNRHRITAQDLEFSLALSDRPMVVMADPTRLEQILFNLLNNAAKYTPAGGRIWLTADPEGGEVVVRVRDTGVGIRPEMLPHIFDLFTQVDTSLQRAQGGLGIGLTLVKTLVEMHGGTVSARSDGPARGSEFTVRLPAFVQSRPAPAPAPAEPGPPPPRRGTSGQGRRVLLVDDNVDSVRGMAKLLTHQGYGVHAVYDGLRAIEAAKSFLPHAVLLDIGLPGMDGYRVADGLRKGEGGTDLIIIAISGYADHQIPGNPGGKLFDSHLVKPVDFDSLLRLLGRMLAEGPKTIEPRDGAPGNR